jgi:YD repeat-containing protein
MPDYRYDLTGNLTSQQYPSGKTVKTEYDSAGRVAGVKNVAGLYYAGAGAADAANRIGYIAGGAASTVRLGSGLWEHTSFNSRLQPTQIGLGTSVTDSSTLRLDYSYGTTDDNGNVRAQSVTAPGMAQPYVQTYSYDTLNRLQSAEETNAQMSTTTPTWRQVYSYDAYGNRTLAAGTTLPVQLDSTNNPSVSAVNNRVTSAGYAYDSAGNLLYDPAHPCAQTPQFTPYYSYDAENKLTNAGGPPSDGGSSYYYDGDGRRVKKVVGGDYGLRLRRHGETRRRVRGRAAAGIRDELRDAGSSGKHACRDRAETGGEREVRLPAVRRGGLRRQRGIRRRRHEAEVHG